MKLLVLTKQYESAEWLVDGLRLEGVKVLCCRGEASEDAVRKDDDQTDIQDADAVLVCLSGWERGMEKLPALRQRCIGMPLLVVGSGERKKTYEEICCLEQGADDYVGMDTPESVILVRLFRLQELYGGRRGSFRCREGLLEMAQQRDYRWDGSALGLTGKEYALLRMLLDAGGDVVPEKDILSRIWNQTDCQDSRVLRTMLRKLRKKLKDTPFTIGSCYGKGYRIYWCSEE